MKISLKNQNSEEKLFVLNTTKTIGLKAAKRLKKSNKKQGDCNDAWEITCTYIEKTSQTIWFIKRISKGRLKFAIFTHEYKLNTIFSMKCKSFATIHYTIISFKNVISRNREHVFTEIFCVHLNSTLMV